MTIDIKEDIIHQISDLADKMNIKAYLVGGFVRDFYLNRPRKDIDITVVGDALEFAKAVANHFNTKIVVYERFRTALVPVGKFELEFVGTRKEVYKTNSRKPIVSEGTFEDDIKRRDFTVNCLAASINRGIKNGLFGEIIDLFDGKLDLENKILRTPLDPIITYGDDPLRMLRAARFASQLNFTIEKESFDAISQMADRIKIISQERISNEFMKILASPNPSKGIAILFKTNLLKYIFPELNELAGTEIKQEGDKKFGHKDVFWHTLKVLDNIVLKTENVWLRFAALMHDIAKPRTKRFNKKTGWSFHGHEDIGARMQKKIFHRMKLPLEKLKYVETLVLLHQRPMHLVGREISDSAIRRLAVSAGLALEDLFILCRADITTKNPNRSEKYFKNYDIVVKKILDVQEKDKLSEFQSPVRGKEIMELCNIKPSRLVGHIKNEIEEAILEGIIPNEHSPAMQYFLENKDEWIQRFGSNT